MNPPGEMQQWVDTLSISQHVLFNQPVDWIQAPLYWLCNL